jgi:hypothetical protein
MKAKATRFFLAVVLFASTGAPLLAEASEWPADRMMPSAHNMLAAPSSTTDGSMTLERIFGAYLYEKTLCSRLAEIVSQHATLPKELDAELRKPNASDEKILSVLLDGALRNEPEIQYVRNHLDYFELPIFFHPISGATQITPNFPLQCLLTEKRILELEALGPSVQAWQARRDLLNDIRDGVSMPWYEGPTELPFFELSNMFDRAKRFFADRDNMANLSEWIAETESFFKQSAEGVDYTAYTHLTKEEQLTLKAEHNETLHTWIATLRRGL